MAEFEKTIIAPTDEGVKRFRLTPVTDEEYAGVKGVQIVDRTRMDTKANERFAHIVDVGRELFAGSNLLTDPNLPEGERDYRKITGIDLELLNQFHKITSPANPDDPWRMEKRTDPRIEDNNDKRRIFDPSFFANWNDPDGPKEHIDLTVQAAPIVLDHIVGNLKDTAEVKQKWAVEAITELKSLDVNLLKAATSLHDTGRLITHDFYRTGSIGDSMLKEIGIRQDLLDMMPSESVMLTKPKEVDDEGNLETHDQAMDRVMTSLPAPAVLTRVLDEFGKRAPGTNRLYQPKDYGRWDRYKWADGYVNRTDSNFPSFQAFAQRFIHIHVNNVPLYFQSMAVWVEEVSNVTLEDVTQNLDKQLSSTLETIKK